MAPIASEVEEVRRRNLDVEMELRQSREREQGLREELQAMMRRLRIAEQAEAHLCSQLGDLEAESVGRARHYSLQIKMLKEQLGQAYALLNEFNLSIQ